MRGGGGPVPLSSHLSSPLCSLLSSFLSSLLSSLLSPLVSPLLSRLSSPLLSSLTALLCKYTLFTYNNILITQVSKTSGGHFRHTTPLSAKLSSSTATYQIKTVTQLSYNTIYHKKCSFAISSMTTKTQNLFILLRRQCDLVLTMVPVWWSRRSWR